MNFFMYIISLKITDFCLSYCSVGLLMVIISSLSRDVSSKNRLKMSLEDISVSWWFAPLVYHYFHSNIYIIKGFDLLILFSLFLCP